MLSPHARKECLTILAIGVLLGVAAALMGWWWALAGIAGLTGATVLFFRDPDRRVPTQRNAVVAPADGRVSSIHELEHFGPFDGPATCVRIFLSVFDVHINRSPCHGKVHAITHTPGKHRNALNQSSVEDNESNLIVFVHAVREQPVAAVRQVAGMLARTIVCTVGEGQVLQRGQRLGLIKLGSTTEVYLPATMQPQVMVRQGQKVYAGSTMIAQALGRIGDVGVGEDDRTPASTGATTVSADAPAASAEVPQPTEPADAGQPAEATQPAQSPIRTETGGSTAQRGSDGALFE